VILRSACKVLGLYLERPPTEFGVWVVLWALQIQRLEGSLAAASTMGFRWDWGDAGDLRACL
jgi:hypothetical protein